jgi:hypothetical protein
VRPERIPAGGARNTCSVPSLVNAPKSHRRGGLAPDEPKDCSIVRPPKPDCNRMERLPSGSVISAPSAASLRVWCARSSA